MKKLLLLSTVLLGTAVASQAGVSVHFNLPLPPLPHVRLGFPVPRFVPPPPVVYVSPPVCAPAPVVYPPTVYYAPPMYAAPPMVVYPALPTYIAPPYGSCAPEYRHCRHHR